ncbi:MAG TPA: peptidylprolyl isomerase [Candidatus Nanoarchaeia archaeon]|nr:peptidylprolyl isomerase [Candidatus Nanoarchaeia archaeon]
MKRVVLVFLLLLLLGCAEEKAEVTQSTMESKTYAIVETSKGNFTILLYEDTPVTTENFVTLAQSGFYDGLTFHRYEPGFVIQGGDPNGDGTGGSAEKIPLEIAQGRSHTRGTIGMARSQDPDSASSQFFVNLGDNYFLDGGYAVFGDVVEGVDVADSLRAGDVMTKVSIVQK